METCIDYQKAISRLIDNEVISPEVRQRIDAHCTECPGCREFRAAAGFISQNTGPAHPGKPVGEFITAFWQRQDAPPPLVENLFTIARKTVFVPAAIIIICCILILQSNGTVQQTTITLEDLYIDNPDNVLLLQTGSLTDELFQSSAAGIKGGTVQ